MQSNIRQAISVCPEAVQKSVQALSGTEQDFLEELRFRLGQPVTALIAGKEHDLICGKTTQQWIDWILGKATGQAVYSSQETLKNGFITLAGGHRLGICGRAVYRNGEVYTFREISSLNLRVARQLFGVAESAFGFLWSHPCSTLIIGPPGRGKTTLLRDLIRLLSDRCGFRICVADERMELAACLDGEAQFDLGKHSDVLSGVKKTEAIELLLRAMNPQWIALDEITALEDVRAMIQASYCGVRFLATAHASCLEELHSRMIYRELLSAGVFENLIVILPNRSLKTERLIANA